ncbi:MAG: EFR1 family ferrodoxin [Bacteroidales bacterium]
MIFYFTGTGNSKWIADELGKHLRESVLSITKILQDADEPAYSVKPDEKIIIVFPVHSWGPAIPVIRFLDKIRFSNINEVIAIACCGDECGLTDQILRNKLSERSIKLAGCYSVEMPNNYILMKGFDVDSSQVALRKQTEASDRIKQIADHINGEKINLELYKKGPLSWLKSFVIYPVFSKWVIGSSRFEATNRCTGCNACARVCPTANISIKNKRPVWSDDCIQCTACIHLCPAKAIEYGKISVKKGRYHHPHYTLKKQN